LEIRNVAGEGGIDFWTALVAIGGSIAGGLVAAGGALWRASGMIEKVRGELERLDRDSALTKIELEKLHEKADVRHLANVNEIHRLANIIAAGPTKADFQRLQDLIMNRLDRIREES
jgi:hypothetical protein